MKSNDSFFPLAASAICGFVVYVAITAASGKNEAWDDGSYYTIGVPLMSIVAFVIGYLFPQKPWRWALSMAGGLADFAENFAAFPRILFSTTCASARSTFAVRPSSTIHAIW